MHRPVISISSIFTLGLSFPSNLLVLLCTRDPLSIRTLTRTTIAFSSYSHIWA